MAAMPRASQVIPSPSGGPLLVEADIQTACPKCGKKQNLEDAGIEESDPLETVYTCHLCQSTILIVSTPGVVPWEGRRYRLGEWMLRNPGAVLVFNKVLIPASRHALD